MPSSRLNCQYDDEKQEFLTPSGRRISLHEIAGMLHSQVECRYDFAGPWQGWRMRGAALIPPRGTIRGPHLKPHNLAAFLRWAAPAHLQPAQPSWREASACLPGRCPAQRP